MRGHGHGGGGHKGRREPSKAPGWGVVLRESALLLREHRARLGAGLILLGVVLMFIWRAKAPAFFRGETLHRDTPTVIAG